MLYVVNVKIIHLPIARGKVPVEVARFLILWVIYFLVGRNRNLLGPSVEREDFRVVYLSSLSQTFTSTCNGLVVVVRYDSFLQEILNFRYQVKRCAAFLFVEIITMYFKISGLM